MCGQNMSLPPRAAAIRGDDYQHVIGWYWCCKMLDDPDIETIGIEDKVGGSFDDIVVRRRQNDNTYIQAKSSNYGDIIVDSRWLFTHAPNGKSPLQHFYGTFASLINEESDFTLELWTNRGFDHKNPLLGKLLDQKSKTIDTYKMLTASERSAVGRERDRWSEHINVSTDELAGFLRMVRWKQTGSEADLRRQAVPLMRLAGLRSDDEAVDIGVAIVRSWVADGQRLLRAADVREEVARRNLLAMDGTLILAVHGIDRDPLPSAPNVQLDFVDLYEGDNSFNRKLLKDASDWNKLVYSRILDAAKTLSSYRVRNVYVVGSMRHPMWFAVGRALPEVKKWVLSADQVDAVWRTNATPEAVAPRVLAHITIGLGTDFALALGLTGDPTAAVDEYVRKSLPEVGYLLTLGPAGGPSRTSVPSDSWAMGWTRAARDMAVEKVRTVGAARVHLFSLAPAGIVLMLGHQWNLMPMTTVYEYADGSYHPTITFPGS